MSRWVETCGCGRETRIEDQRFVIRTPAKAEPCPHPHPSQDLEPSVVMELGGCGCGQPERVDAMMLAYLESRAGEGFPKPDPAGVSEDAALLLAYLADMLDWTEHGGSVGGAWLTDEGERALAHLRSAPPR